MSANLPTPLTRFVGRAAELAEAMALLGRERLLTLTGPGGAGKTRLALSVAAAVAADYPDGVWFTDLSPLSDGRFVWDQVAAAVGVKEPTAGATVAQAVGRHLATRRALLVLDNCEHVVAAAAEVTGAVLAAAPAVKVIATSREPLAVGGEVTWTVPPLSEADGIELFTARCSQVRPRLRLRDEDTIAMRSICRHLDGLPSAIELAAARTRALAPARIAAHLHDHLRVLSGGPRTAPSRQATLRASFEWSHALLTPGEQALLRQLSVFAGGFDIEAALAVCPAATIDLLATLTDRSLIAVDDCTGQPEPRYRMLETIRQYAAEHLAQAGEADQVHTRHRDHYLNLAEAAEPQLIGHEQDRWLGQLRSEQDNLRAALAWSQDHGDSEALARTVTALSLYWAILHRYTEFQMWLTAAAARAEDLPPRLLARIRNFQCLAIVYGTSASFGDVPALANEALALARTSGDKREEAIALLNLGTMAGLTSGGLAMRPDIEQALHLIDSTVYPPVAVGWLGVYLALRWFQSDPQETRRVAEQAIALSAAPQDRHVLLFALSLGGVTALVQGRLADAAHLFETVVARGGQDDEAGVWNGHLGLAWVAMFHGDFAVANTAVAQARAAAQRSGAESGSIQGVEPVARWLVGWMQLAGGDPAQARQSLAPVVDVFRALIVPGWAALPLVTLAQAQLALGELDHAAASLDEAAALARSAALTWVLGRAGLVRARLHARHRDLPQATSLAHQALGHAREAGDQLGLADVLELLAALAAEQDSHKEAVRVCAAADTLRAELGYPRFPIDQAPHQAALAASRRALGADGFAAAWSQGSQLTTEAAIAYATRRRGERRRPAVGWASLTPTELEVARLVGQHLTNPEIATTLFVSRATVKTHLIHIFAKLGIDSRSQLAAEAIDRGIPQRSARQS